MNKLICIDCGQEIKNDQLRFKVWSLDALGNTLIRAFVHLHHPVVDTLPLDPEPWTIHSLDSGEVRFATKSACWLGYRAVFAPREGFSLDPNRYPEER